MEVFPRTTCKAWRPTLSSPRPWRCFRRPRSQGAARQVFSTSVEVFLQKLIAHTLAGCLLHVRGGVSEELQPLCQAQGVFSTSVEVFPWSKGSPTASSSLLHVRGGVSKCLTIINGVFRSSPRPWRCFRRSLLHYRADTVFSTSVEVFSGWQKELTSQSRLLHVRGGVSAPTGVFPPSTTSSPRPWRCFQVNSITKEGFTGLLHVRGGVSVTKAPNRAKPVSSPRPWRCFLLRHQYRFRDCVFSTSVEVFLS